MPVSDKHKLILVHIRKTGGTSIEKAMGIFDNDYLLPEIKLYCIKNGRNLKHLNAREIKEVMGKKQYKEYFKFSVVRNPYTRLVSSYFYFNIDKKMPFDKFLKDIVLQNKTERYYSQFYCLSDEKGRIIVDSILRFENLEEDFNRLMKKLKLNFKLPYINKTTYNPNQVIYTERGKKLIEKLYKKDIKFFGYGDYSPKTQPIFTHYFKWYTKFTINYIKQIPKKLLDKLYYLSAFLKVKSDFYSRFVNNVKKIFAIK